MTTLPQLACVNTSTEDVDVSFMVQIPGETFPVDDARWRCTLRHPDDPSDVVVDFRSEADAPAHISLSDPEAETGWITLSFVARRQPLYGRAGVFTGEVMMEREGRAGAVAELSITVNAGATYPREP